MDEDNVRFMPNKKRPGSAAHRRYALYSSARTVKQAMALGWMREDRGFDLAHGYVKIVGLDARPASTECLVEDKSVEFPPAPAGRAVPVRLAEVTERNPGLHLSRACIWPLLQRCEVFNMSTKGSWARLASRSGPFSQVSLPIFRILLQWANTGRLAFARAQGSALAAALRHLGVKATAVRIEEWLEKRALKFSTFVSGLAVAESQLASCGDSSAKIGPKHARGLRKRAPAQPGDSKEAPAKPRLLEMLKRPTPSDASLCNAAVACGVSQERVATTAEPAAETGTGAKDDCRAGVAALPSSASPLPPAQASSASEDCCKEGSLPDAGSNVLEGAFGAATSADAAPSFTTKPASAPLVKEEVVVVIGGRLHRQKNLRALFAGRNGG